jgi:hypothetical protein
MDPDTPLFKLTVGELMDLIERRIKEQPAAESDRQIAPAGKRYVYGLAGIASLFGCSRTQAHRIKKSGKIDGAIKQTGRLIIVDAEKALELASRKKKTVAH